MKNVQDRLYWKIVANTVENSVIDSLFSDKHCIVEVLSDVNCGKGYYWAGSPAMDQLNVNKKEDKNT